MRAPFRWLPAELTMLNDLSVFTDPWRKKRPVGNTEGDPQRSERADPRAYYLYFPDDGTWGREERDGAAGFRLRGGARAEVILRALEPVQKMRVTVTGGPGGDEVAVTAGGRTQHVRVGPAESATVDFDTGPGFAWYDTFVHVFRFRSTRGGPPGSSDPEGAFVHVDLDVNERRR